MVSSTLVERAGRVGESAGAWVVGRLSRLLLLAVHAVGRGVASLKGGLALCGAPRVCSWLLVCASHHVSRFLRIDCAGLEDWAEEVVAARRVVGVEAEGNVSTSRNACRVGV